MIGKPATGVHADILITIDGVEVNYTSILSMDLRVEEGLHDMATLSMAGIPPRALTDYLQRPVHIRISTGASFVHEFYGTVEKILPVAKVRDGLVNGSQFQQAEIICMGASYSMRGTRSEVWDAPTMTDMAIRMAERYGYSCAVPTVPSLAPQYVQSGISDWAALKDYAAEHGYMVNVHGTHLHVYSPDNAISHNRSLHKLRTASTGTARPIPGQIMEFHPVITRQALDGDHMNTVVQVINGTSLYNVDAKEVYGNPGKPSYQRDLGLHADTYEEAVAAIRSAKAGVREVQATAVCMGTAGSYPGGVVDIDNYDSALDGIWLVKSVRHTVNDSAFVTEFSLYRDLSDILGTVPVASFKRPSLPTLTRGVWRSSVKEIQQYATR